MTDKAEDESIQCVVTSAELFVLILVMPCTPNILS